MPPDETLGQRIRRVRTERGMSLAKVSGPDFSRAFLHQSSTAAASRQHRVLRVIAGPSRDGVDYLLEGRLPGVERELAPGERARAAGPGGRAPGAGGAASGCRVDEWPLGTDARLCQAEALLAVGREKESRETLVREKEVIQAHHDRAPAAATPSD